MNEPTLSTASNERRPRSGWLHRPDGQNFIMSDTPKTDAAIYPMDQVDIIWPEFARELERENARLRELLGKLHRFCLAAGHGTSTPTMNAVERILSNA